MILSMMIYMAICLDDAPDAADDVADVDGLTTNGDNREKAATSAITTNRVKVLLPSPPPPPPASSSKKAPSLFVPSPSTAEPPLSPPPSSKTKLTVEQLKVEPTLNGELPSVSAVTTRSSSSTSSSSITLSSTQTKPEEQCIISSSEAEDHIYTTTTSLANTPSTESISLPNNIDTSKTKSQTSSNSSKNSRSRNRRKATPKVVEIVESQPPPTTTTSSGVPLKTNKSRQKSPRTSSWRSSKAKAIEIETPTATSIQTTSVPENNSCFRRFYLQRQQDGTSLLFVPADELSSSNKGNKLVHPNNNSTSITTIIPSTAARQSSLLILGEPSNTTRSTSSSTPSAVVPVVSAESLGQQPATLLMRIEKSALAPLVTLLDGPSSAPTTTTTTVRSITDLLQQPSTSSSFTSSSSPLFSTTLSLTGKVLTSSTSTSTSNNNHNTSANMRFTGSFPQHQQSQSRAILSAHKQQQQQQLQELSSPPPMITQPSSAVGSKSMFNSLSSMDGAGNVVLPPVETILGTNSSLLQHQLSADEPFSSVSGFGGNTSSLLDSDYNFDEEIYDKYLPFGICNVDATEEEEEGDLQFCSADLISTGSATSSPLLSSSSAPLIGSSGAAAAHDLGVKQQQQQPGNHQQALHILLDSTTSDNGHSSLVNEMVDDLGGDYAAAVDDMFDFGFSGNTSLGSRISPHCAMQTTHLMTCDNDPLISGNDMMKNGGFMRVHSSHSVSNGIPIPAPLSGTSGINGPGSNSLPTYIMANEYATSMISSGAFFESKAEVEEDEEDDSKTVVGWMADSVVVNGRQNHQFQRQSSMVDLNRQQQQQQQNSLITSTSSPTMLNTKQQQHFWSYEQQNGQVNGDNIVSSSSLMTVEMDDTSLEIETILQGELAIQNRSGHYLNSISSTGSPPKLSSSLPSGGFKSPNTLKHQQQLLQLKKPFFVNQQQQQQQSQAPLLTGLLQASSSANVNELLRSANGPMVIATNGLVSQNGTPQMAAANGAAAGNMLFALKSPNSNNNRGFNGNSNNCPTLATLIASGSSVPSSSSSNVLLSSSLPPISNLRGGSGGVPHSSTILQQQQIALNNRNRNNSMSTDYSVSSHDEGFGSQPDEDDAELDGAGGLISDQCSDTGSLMDDMMEMMVSGGAGDVGGDFMVGGEDVGDAYLSFLNSHPQSNGGKISCSSNNAGSNLATINSFDSSFGAGNDGLNASTSNSSDSTINGTTVIKQEHLEKEPMWCSTSTAVNSVQRSAEVFNNNGGVHSVLQTNNNKHHLLQQYHQKQQSVDEAEEESMAGGSEEAEEEDGAPFEEDDDDESFYGDYEMSDLLGASTSDDKNNKWSLNMGRSRKGTEKRYFWQYNVQSKGPKGPRYATGASGTVSNNSDDEEDDPHVFNEIADPVFAPDCQVEGVKHSGKARRGDGNDLTPNPKKLLMIGLELKKLSKVINELTPVTEVPAQSRNKSRKEKNKLASRACRLKKKAQHEANKIKLRGLYLEHAKMLRQIDGLRKVVEGGVKIARAGQKGQSNAPVSITVDGATYQVAPAGHSSTVHLESIVEVVSTRHQTLQEVAGRTAEYVNGVLDNVTMGNFGGGIDNV